MIPWMSVHACGNIFKKFLDLKKYISLLCLYCTTKYAVYFVFCVLFFFLCGVGMHGVMLGKVQSTEQLTVSSVSDCFRVSSRSTPLGLALNYHRCWNRNSMTFFFFVLEMWALRKSWPWNPFSTMITNQNISNGIFCYILYKHAMWDVALC